jgi:hypothetical protein
MLSRPWKEAMKQGCLFALSLFSCTVGMIAQNDARTIKVEVKSAFVWGEDDPSGAISSLVQDPLTGNAIHKLSYGGVEVSSRLGFEGLGRDEEGTFLNYTTTIVNSTEARLTLRYGGISVDGHAASPVRLVPGGKKLNKKDGRQSKEEIVELWKMHCITSGFLPSDNLFSANTSAKVLTVAPATALTVSSIIRDPRSYHSILCTTAGCYPTGTIRYYVRVDNLDYVFVWPGRSAVYCGK